MLFGDSHLLVNLIMIELLGTVFFLAAVTICLYIKRFFVRKSLSGYKVLITNGDTSFSQELAEQLSFKHDCHVILVKNRLNNTNGDDSTSASQASPNSHGISVFHCNITDGEDLEKLSKQVHDTYNGIDIVIDNATNGIISAAKKDDCRIFIDKTSEKLRTTINMLMHFIPKLKCSNRGHFVTVQPIMSNKKPLLSSYREIKELINLLTDNRQSTFDIFNKQKIRLTTVLWNFENTVSNGHNNNNNLADITKITEQILDGIRADRSVVHINKSNNLMDSIRNYFHRRNTSNIDCDDHSQVR